MSSLHRAAQERGPHEQLAELREAAAAAPLAVEAVAEMIRDGDLRSLDKLERLSEWACGIGRLAMSLRLALVRSMQDESARARDRS